MTGNRLSAQTGRVLDRVSTLALMYRLSGRDPYLRRAVLELRAAANFRDWNPARFVETAELLHAFAIGYDWLYNSLAPGERAWMRDAMVNRALDPALAAYRLDSGWPKEHLNWNMVCNSAMGPRMAFRPMARKAPGPRAPPTGTWSPNMPPCSSARCRLRSTTISASAFFTASTAPDAFAST
jgi:hypothetical protein